MCLEKTQQSSSGMDRGIEGGASRKFEVEEVGEAGGLSSKGQPQTSLQGCGVGNNTLTST